LAKLSDSKLQRMWPDIRHLIVLHQKVQHLESGEMANYFAYKTSKKMLTNH